MQNTTYTPSPYPYPQHNLFDLPLPPLLHTAKNTLTSFILPKLSKLINCLQNKQQDSPIVTMLCVIVLVLLLRDLLTGLFSKNKPKATGAAGPVLQGEVDEEIRALGNQIRNLKASLKKIIQGTVAASASVKDPQQQPHPQITGTQTYLTSDITKLISYYKEAAEDFNNLADYILDTQQSIFREIKNLKRLRSANERNSSHGSRDDNGSEAWDRAKEIQDNGSNMKSNVQIHNESTDKVIQKQQTQQFPQQQQTQPEKQPQQTPIPIAKAPPKIIKPPGPIGGPKKRMAPPPPPTR